MTFPDEKEQVYSTSLIPLTPSEVFQKVRTRTSDNDIVQLAHSPIPIMKSTFKNLFNHVHFARSIKGPSC